MIKIGICDESRCDCESLEAIIRSNSEGRVILIKRYNNMAAFKWAIEDEEEFDALFVCIGSGCIFTNNVYGVGDEFIKDKNWSARIILMSETMEDCVNAFEIDAFGFICKPFNRKKVGAVCRKLFRIFHDEDIIAVHKRGMVINVKLDDVVYIKRNGRKISIIRKVGENLSVYDNIEEIEYKISKMNPAFCRLHNSHIVNMGKIRTYNRDVVEMENGDVLNISRRYVEIVKKRYRDEFLKGRVSIGKVGKGAYDRKKKE